MTQDSRESGLGVKQAMFKPSVINRQRRTLSTDTQMENYATENRLRVPVGVTALIPTKCPVQMKSPKKVNLTLRGVDYLTSEPHISRLKERVRQFKAQASPKANCSLLSMDRSKFWQARRDSEIKAKQEEQERRKEAEFKPREGVNERPCDLTKVLKPTLTRPTSCTKLIQKDRPREVKPKRRRTLSNSYLELHQIKKKSSLSFILGEETLSPASRGKLPCTKPESLDTSFQGTPSHSKGSQLVSELSGYASLSPARHLYSFSSGFGNQRVVRSKSPLQAALTLDLSFCRRI
jgi:hypothetical protein